MGLLGYARLEAVTGMHRRHFADALQTLERLGIIWRDARHGRRTRYFVTLTGATPVTSTDGGTSSGGGTSTAGGTATGSTGGTTTGTDGGTRTDQITVQITDQSQYLAPSSPSAASAQGSKPPRPTRERAKKQEEAPDPRVRPVQEAFVAAFKEAVGHEPTPRHFTYGRAGKLIRELPASYTAEVLVAAVPRFFQAPGYVRRNLSFQAFIDALPRLVSGEVGRPAADRRRRAHIGPDRTEADYTDWFRGSEHRDGADATGHCRGEGGAR